VIQDPIAERLADPAPSEATAMRTVSVDPVISRQALAAAKIVWHAHKLPIRGDSVLR